MWNNHLGQVLGFSWPGFYFGMGSAGNLNAANTYTAFGLYMQEASNTLASVDLYINSIQLTGNQITVEVWSADSLTLKPSSIIANGGSTPTSVTATGWLNVPFGTPPTLAANTFYWIVCKNTNGTPGTYYFALRQGSATPFVMGGMIANSYGHCAICGCSAGVWGAPSGGRALYRANFGDSTFDGMPLENTGFMSSVYGSRESGVQFTTPANVNLNVIGVRLPVFRYSGDTYTFAFKMYTGASPALLATTNYSLGQSYAAGSAYDNVNFFSSSQQIPAGTVVTLTLYNPSGDSTHYVESYYLKVKADATSIIPMSAQQAENLSGSWAYTSGQFPPFALILDPATPYYSGGGVGSPIFSRIRSGF
jgi:hypothetical protein